MTLLLLNTTIKISLIVLAAMAATMVLRRRSAAVRHFVLAAALACAAATPALRLVAPTWQATAGTWFTASRAVLIDRPLAVLDDSTTTTPSSRPHALEGGRWNTAAIARALGIIWITGLGASVFVLLAGLFRLTWIASRAGRVTDGPWVDAAADLAHAYGLRRPPLLLQGDHASLLGTWGFLRAKVLLPVDAPHWPADRIRIVLGHELAHVRRRDWAVQLGAESLRAIYWFNPLLWLACRRLRLESEHACDDAVLKLGVEGQAYATELVDLARAFRSARPVFVPAAAIARPSSLERRVRAMLNVHLDRDPITRTASLAAAIVLAIVTVLVAGFGASAQSQFATLSGSIVDQKTRPLPGVTLTLSNAQSQSKYEIKSDPTGHYEFVGLPPGNYVLLFELPGFASIKREGISLAGQAFQLDSVMQVGSIQETITITDSDITRQPQAPITAGPRTPRPAPKLSCGPDNTLGGCIQPPTKTKDVRPIYPIGGKSGDVQLAAVIGTDGRVATVDVVGDGGGGAADVSLSHAAATAVSQWEFTPTYLDGEPIDVRMKVNVHFVAK
jgi:beta-lactamase regulating signal transducer with metallopeptidase domain